MSLSIESQSYLISGMGSTFAGNELISAIQNQSVLSSNTFTRLQDCLGEDDVASNFQACILGSYQLSPRDAQFIKDGFSLPASALASVLANLAGGVQAPQFPNFLPPSAPNSFPNAFANSSPVNVTMPAGFSFAVNFIPPAYQQWDVLTFPAGSTFPASGAGAYFEIFTGGNSNDYYIWYNVSGGNTNPAPAGFVGIEVDITAADSASTVASKTNAAFPASSAPVSQLGVAATYAALGYSALTGSTGMGSTLTGNIGLYPNTGSSITNFPPSTYTGTENAGNAAAAAAQAAAQAAYTSLQGMTATTIPAELGGQSLAPGVYTSSGGTFTLNGTLTLTGSASSQYVFQTASTLITGGVTTPVMSIGSVSAGNIYWVVGSSATINSANSGTFYGNVIAQASITDTEGGTINGSLVALTGAITYSATTASNTANTGPGSPGIAEASSFASANTVTVVLAPISAAVARPAFSVPSGTYGATQSVTISSGTAGATMYYTVDGTQPTINSTVYSGPISVSASETIRVLAVKAGLANSTASASYVIT